MVLRGSREHECYSISLQVVRSLGPERLREYRNSTAGGSCPASGASSLTWAQARAVSVLPLTEQIPDRLDANAAFQ